ncbi:hypothetical protein AYO40_02315 [Planctomycetaceae bacterium SCGC AG-212-D15]|nr:hypothetical protein AYO40_02315 [Planctomycetaceae bacterium SCGC AG-212-D15]
MNPIETLESYFDSQLPKKKATQHNGVPAEYAKKLEPLLQALLSNDEDRRRWGSVDAFPQLIPQVVDMVLDLLLGRLKRADSDLRSRVCRALTALGQPALDRLTFDLACARDARTRIRLIELLADVSPSDHPFVVAALMRQAMMASKDSEVQVAAIKALRRVAPDMGNNKEADGEYIFTQRPP